MAHTISYELALTIVIVVIILLLNLDTVTTFAIIGLLLLSTKSCGSSLPIQTVGRPIQTVGHPIVVPAAATAAAPWSKYPGAIDANDDAVDADDEANDEAIDGDERLVYQAQSRNDLVRVTEGTMNRRRDLDKYFREEVEEEENRIWYSRHEY